MKNKSILFVIAWYVLEGDIMVQLEFAKKKDAIYLTEHDHFLVREICVSNI